LNGPEELRHTGVVKNYQRVTSGAAGVPQSVETDASTRHRVASSILEHGPSTAAELAQRLGLTPAAIRRHLDVLLASGHLEARERRIYGARRRGRPAKVFVLTDAGRSVFYTAYDGLAVDALEFLAASSGSDAVTLFAESRMARSEERYRTRISNTTPNTTPTQALAAALSEDGYVASTLPSASGEQLCQHHCPVAHVAERFPQICEVETAAFSRLLGVHVQRLATIAHGDGVCTTHVPHVSSPSRRKTTTDMTTSERA
jgi:predicted ArsR family transcriptional regulator